MSQQALDLRRSIHIMRRHLKLSGAIIALGLAAGVGYAVLKPPMLTSTALVVLPQSATQNAQQSSSSGTDSVIATQVVIAGSDAVLTGALPHVSPPLSLAKLHTKVQVAPVAGSILSISANGATAQQAEDTANAVANSYVAYVGSPTSPVGHMAVKVLESAATATGTKLPVQIAIFGVLGAIAGALVGFILSLVLDRSDRRLVERDAIANSIAAPVLASLPVNHPSDAASWVKLMDEYDPQVVDAWVINRMLQRFGVADNGFENNAHKSRFSLNVLSLAADSSALALGPQMAAFAASMGIPTALVIGPQQDVNTVATLRTACSAPQASAGMRRPLRLVVSDDGNLGQLRASFIVVVTVVDGRDPHIPDTVRTTTTVLGVSAGAATAEQLARIATAAAADGREIVGIVVANPEPTDQTTGRVARLAPPMRRALPTRVNGVPMESRR
jgi:capsular polysaccharide biosynthesis protein